MSISATRYAALHRKIDLRLLPYLFVLYVVAYLDRVNVSFAAHGLTQSLGFTSSVFGLGAGMFFAGYVLCEVPSNLILRRVGARLWIARIMVTWGLVACGMALVHAAWSFHTLRFLLGVAEAGFLPGIIYYLTLWYPQKRRARAVALFMAATPVAGIVGAPLSGLLLGMHGLWDVEGWRWMFVLEGIPAVLLGFSVLWFLPDGPAGAHWLTDPEREALASELAGSPEEDKAPGAPPWPPGARRRVWTLSAAYFSLCSACTAWSCGMPTIIGEIWGRRPVPCTWAAVGDSLSGGVLGMVLVADIRTHGRTSLAHGRPLFVSAAGFLLSIAPMGQWLGEDLGPWWSLGCFTVSTVGLWGMLGPFWTIPTGFLSGAAAAGGVALINSIGNAGGFVGPTLVGMVRDATGSHRYGFLFIAATMALGGWCILRVTRER